MVTDLLVKDKDKRETEIFWSLQEAEEDTICTHQYEQDLNMGLFED